MSNHWEFFSCRMEDSTAFIFYDHGFSEKIDRTDIDKLLKIKVAIKNPSEDGHPEDDEIEALNIVEDEIQSFVTEYDGYYVGRATVEGSIYFHCYVNIEDNEARKLIKKIENDYGYVLKYGIKNDPKKEGYWQDLFPTENEWRVIQDLKVIEILEKHGDSLQIERRIDHWVLFDSSVDMHEFGIWAEEEGFSIECITDPDDKIKKYCMQIYHFGTPELNDINYYTLLLLMKAKDFNGEYDGWETSVEKEID